MSSEFNQWLLELGGRPHEGLFLFDNPIPLFVVAGVLLPEHVQEALVFDGQDAEYVEKCIFELLGDSLQMQELLTIEIDDPYRANTERRLYAATTQSFCAWVIQTTEEDELPLHMAMAIGPKNSDLCAILFGEVQLGAWGIPSGSIARVINRAPSLLCRARVAKFAAALTGEHIPDSLVI